MKQFCIVIPIYKSSLDPIEEISIKSLKNIVEDKNYDIYFITHMGINRENYIKYFPKAKFKYFKRSYFENTKTYSYLCLSYDFYNRFSAYEFMLIYQLDCYLFRDEISAWCNKNYDYIGAPIFSNNAGWSLEKIDQNGKVILSPVVGNGGLSLRKIETFKNMFDPNGEFRQEYELTDKIFKKVIYEDWYICNVISRFYDIHIASWEDACKFSLDMNVEAFYDASDSNELPMGTHAWDKNIRFWKKVIPELKNNKTVSDFCEEKHKEFFKIYYSEK